MTDRWPFGALLAAAPALLALPLFEAARGFPVLTPAEVDAVRATLADARHPKGLAAYVAFVVWHAGLCALAGSLAGRRIAALPGPLRRRAIVVASALALGASAGLLAAGASDATLARLTHGLPAEMMEASPLGRWWFTMGLVVPSVLGIATTAVVAVAAHAEVVAARPTGADGAAVATGLGTLLRALSLVLVSSAAGATLFFHLPADLYAGGGGGPADEALLARLLTLAGEVSVFWAAIYTATLFGAVGVPLLVAHRRAGGGLGGGPETPFAASVALVERAAVMLSPLLGALATRALSTAGLGA